MLIEFDGRQHFENNHYFFKKNNDKFLDQQERDMIKTRYCFKNNISLLRIPYTRIKNISIILRNFIDKVKLSCTKPCFQFGIEDDGSKLYKLHTEIITQ